jgi:hypothetical protein
MKRKTLTMIRDTLLIVALLVVVVTAIGMMQGCTRRSLEGDLDPRTALIPVHIDWSKSGVDTTKMHRASVLLFPEDGGEPLEYRLQESLTDKDIQVPEGVYSVIVFNETTDDTDWKYITITGKDNYQKFAAVAKTVTSRSYKYNGNVYIEYIRSDTLPLIEDPDQLAAWSLDRFEVTKEVLLRSRSTRGTRAGSRAEEILDEQIASLTNIVPTPRIETMTVTARVENLTSAAAITGILDGMSSGVFMASGERMTTIGAHTFSLNGRKYSDFTDDDDDESDDGTTTKTFNVFGRQPADSHVDLYIDFLLADGTMHPRELFDVTNKIERYTETIPVSDSLLVGFTSRGPDEPDHEIILPDMNVDAAVTVDDWEEITIPLK